MKLSLSHLAFTAMTFALTACHSVPSQPTTSAPATLQVPTDQAFAFELAAKGVQIYSCKASAKDASRFEWTFVAPEAELFRGNNMDKVGQHGAGPFWAMNDGGRIVGEGCHFIDLLRHLAGSPIVACHTVAMGRHPAVAIADDKATITLQFADGSFGTVHYLANGDKGFPKERLEVFCAGRVLQLDNFRKLRGWGWKGFSKMNLWRQDKGQAACAQAFVDVVKSGGPCPISLDEVLEVSRVSIDVQQALEG